MLGRALLSARRAAFSTPLSGKFTNLVRKEWLLTTASFSSDASSLRSRALQWAGWDTNASTRDEVHAMVEKGDRVSMQELEAAFGSRVAFGTAGLRAEMGPGPARMNELTVLQASQGLLRHLEDELGEAELRRRGIAVGFDHRARGTLCSEQFGRLCAAVFVSQEVPVRLLTGLVPTPLVPFCVEQHECAAGVMVTASHNPKQDNGYKVYWGNGAQIIPPHDAGIAAQIENNLEPWLGSEGYNELAARVEYDALCQVLTDEVAAAYFDAQAARLCRRGAEQNSRSSVRAVYSAMHGVGGQWTSRAVEGFGFRVAQSCMTESSAQTEATSHVVPVALQHEPDPTFPTVAFPNPEEGEGALQLAFDTADQHGCDLVLANDPDADRLAVAERVGAGQGGGWRIFTGNEIGALFGEWQWRNYAGAAGGSEDGRAAMLASTVSSKFLGAMAAQEGFTFEETLTGFKWMGSRTEQLRAEGTDVLFAYEEAIGFCIGDLVKDKDGVTAAAVFMELAATLHEEGRTVAEHLDTLYERYGHFVACNHYLKCYDPATTDAIFARLRNEGKYWQSVGGYNISHVRDLTTGHDSSQPTGQATLPTDPSSHMITYTLANGCVATLRTSGTEPKIKYYCEMAGTPGQPRAEVETEVQIVAEAIVNEMLQPDVNNLERPL